MIRRPPRSTQSRSSAASDVYKRQEHPSVGTLGRRPSPPPATSGGHRESPGAYCRKTLPQSSCFRSDGDSIGRLKGDSRLVSPQSFLEEFLDLFCHTRAPTCEIGNHTMVPIYSSIYKMSIQGAGGQGTCVPTFIHKLLDDPDALHCVLGPGIRMRECGHLLIHGSSADHDG